MKQSVLSDLDAKLFKKYNLFRFHATLVDKLKTILEFNLWREGFDHKQQKSAFYSIHENLDSKKKLEKFHCYMF